MNETILEPEASDAVPRAARVSLRASSAEQLLSERSERSPSPYPHLRELIALLEGRDWELEK